MTNQLDYYQAKEYRNPNCGRNGREEGLVSLLIHGGRTADALRGRRFFASAINLADYFGGLYGGPSGPPVRVSGDTNPCGPSFFGARQKDCAP